MKAIYLIPDVKRIEESIELAKECGAFFEYNDFYAPAVLDNEEELQKRIAFYKGLSRDRSQDTLHGAFLDITIHSEDARIREISEQRVRQCMDIAKELNIRGVVFHTNTIPNFRVESYRKNWIACNEKFWKQILEEYPTLSVFLENMFDEKPMLLAELARRMQDEERFGICFDYAHAQVFGQNIDEWIEAFGPYIKHMHINDNDLLADLHQSVGQGQIDWESYNEKIGTAKIESSVLIEVKDLQKQKESLEFMQKNRIYPY